MCIKSYHRPRALIRVRPASFKAQLGYKCIPATVDETTTCPTSTVNLSTKVALICRVGDNLGAARFSHRHSMKLDRNILWTTTQSRQRCHSRFWCKLQTNLCNKMTTVRWRGRGVRGRRGRCNDAEVDDVDADEPTVPGTRSGFEAAIAHQECGDDVQKRVGLTFCAPPSWI